MRSFARDNCHHSTLLNILVYYVVVAELFAMITCANLNHHPTWLMSGGLALDQHGGYNLCLHLRIVPHVAKCLIANQMSTTYLDD